MTEFSEKTSPTRTSPLRVLNVNEGLDPFCGGTHVRTVEMTRAEVQFGMQVTLLVTDRGLGASYVEQVRGSKLLAIPCLIPRFYVPMPRFREIRNAVAGAEIIHLMGHWSLLNILVYRAAKKMGKPYVVCAAGSLPIRGRSRLLKYIYNFWVGRRIIRGANRLIAITDSEHADYLEYGVDPKKIVTIPNAIQLNDASDAQGAGARSRFKLGNAPVVFFLGRLNWIKGPDLLIEAFGKIAAEFPEHLVALAGPDEGLLPGILERAKALGFSDRLRPLGHVSKAEKYNLLRAASLLVVPSRHDAMSLVAVEAGAVGTPVLLTDQCGFAEVQAVDGGRVVPATAEGIAEGLRELLSDPVALKKCGENLRRFCVESYSWDAMVMKFEGLYLRILNGTTP